jgi:hypothetical protein
MDTAALLFAFQMIENNGGDAPRLWNVTCGNRCGQIFPRNFPDGVHGM